MSPAEPIDSLVLPNQPQLAGIQLQFDSSLKMGQPLQIAEGIWWIKLPLVSSLEHINVYALRDNDGLTLVDTGVDSAVSRNTLENALNSSELSGLPLKRVIVTHFHPDHIGLAGWLAEDRAASLWMTRTTWLTCKLLLQSQQSVKANEIEFMRRAGMSAIELEAYRRQASSRYHSQVTALPDQFVPLSESQCVTIGSRSWKVYIGNGHAAGHLTLWTEGLALVGDQVLPGISANLTVPFTEPEGDLVEEWLLSCEKLASVSDNQLLGLPGHQRPFTGVQYRLEQIQENIRNAMDRLRKILVRPSTALQCMEQFHLRSISFDQRKTLLPEIVGFLNHLCRQGDAERSLSPQGAFLYCRKRSTRSMVVTSLQSNSEKVSFTRGNAASYVPKEFAMQSPHDNSGNPDPLSNQELTRDSIVATDHGGSTHETTISGEPDSSSFEIAETSQQGEFFDPETYHSKLQELYEMNSPTFTERVATLFQPKRLLAAAFLSTTLLIVYSSRSQILEWSQKITTQVEPSQNFASNELSHQKLLTTITPVQVVTLQEQDRTELPRRFTGVIKPRRASEVGFNRIGTVEEILVERGQQVEKDQVLAKLNVASLQASLKAVEAQFNAARARMDEMVAGPRAQTIDAARNQVAAANAELELALTSLGRAERLVSIGAVSQQEVDSASTNVKAKREALKVAQNTLDELLEGTRTEQISGQRAVLMQLEASQEELQVQLMESVIKAPFTAVISERYIDPGAVCSPGVAVLRLVELDAAEAWIGLPPEYLSSIKQDATYELMINQKKTIARLKTILPELDSGTRTSTVVFELLDTDARSNLGKVAEIELSRVIDEKGFWLPMSAIVRGDQGLWGVLVLEKCDAPAQFKLAKRELEVIHVDSDRVYARGTINQGDQVVATGLHRLTMGQIVQLPSDLTDTQSDSQNLTQQP